MLYDPKMNINNDNSKLHIRVTLESIKHLSKNLTKGPMNHMLKWCKPEELIEYDEFDGEEEDEED